MMITSNTTHAQCQSLHLHIANLSYTCNLWCSGMGASAIGLSHVAVQFPVYEYFKKSLGERRQKERGEATVADRLSTVDLILASSSSKVIGHRPSQPPAYQLAVCASVATVTPAHLKPFCRLSLSFLQLRYCCHQLHFGLLVQLDVVAFGKMRLRLMTAGMQQHCEQSPAPFGTALGTFHSDVLFPLSTLQPGQTAAGFRSPKTCTIMYVGHL